MDHAVKDDSVVDLIQESLATMDLVGLAAINQAAIYEAAMNKTGMDQDGHESNHFHVPIYLVLSYHRSGNHEFCRLIPRRSGWCRLVRLRSIFHRLNLYKSVSRGFS